METRSVQAPRCRRQWAVAAGARVGAVLGLGWRLPARAHAHERESAVELDRYPSWRVGSGGQGGACCAVEKVGETALALRGQAEEVVRGTCGRHDIKR